MIDPHAAAKERACLDALTAAGVSHETQHHPPVDTVAEAKRLRGAISGAHIKNLFLCDRKKRRFWLLSAEESRRVDLKALAAHLGERALRFANATHLEEKLGILPGAVTPLACMNDTAGEVTMLLDAGLLAFESVNAHPLHNAATTRVGTTDLIRFLTSVGHEPMLVDLEGLSA